METKYYTDGVNFYSVSDTEWDSIEDKDVTELTEKEFTESRQSHYMERLVIASPKEEAVAQEAKKGTN